MIRIVVANPGTIPGGIETVHKAVLQHLAHGEFELIEHEEEVTSLGHVQGLRDSYTYETARRAFKKTPEAHVGLCFSRGEEYSTDGPLEAMVTVTVCTAIGKAGLSSESSRMYRPDSSPEVDAKEMISSVLKRRMLTELKSPLYA